MECERPQAQTNFSELRTLIRDNGILWEDVDVTSPTVDEYGQSNLFSGHKVYCEDGGFEVWIGSLEDALCLRALRDRGINGVLNVAVLECMRDCAGFTGGACVGGRARGRQRTHARGTSIDHAADSTESRGELTSLHMTEIRSLATFDDVWYSQALGCDVDYLGIEADDVENYPIQDHFLDATEFLLRCRHESRKVFVHCVMGINRSAACTVAFLCSGMGMTLREAIDLVSIRRGHVLSNSSFLQQLIDNFAETSEKDPCASQLADGG